MNWILIKAVIKARKNGLLRLTPTTVPTWLDCPAGTCAKCCEFLGSPVITPDEAERIDSQWIVKDKDAIFIRSQDSVCCLLKESLCSIYQDRPKGCIEYPWYNIDGRLYYDSGCPGIKHDKDDRPNVNDIHPFEYFFPQTPKFIIRLIKKICVRK